MKRYLFYIEQLYSFAIVRPLQEAIIERGDTVAWFIVDKEKLSPYLKADEKLLHSVSEVKNYNPCAVFVPGNVVPGFFPGVKVGLFHGFNAKKRPEDRGHYRIRNFFDLYCTQGPATTEKFIKLSQQHKTFDVVETGWPKMDPLYSTESTDCKNQPLSKTVFFASTFTEKLSAAAPLLETIKQLSQTMDWNWIINFHPKMDPAIIRAYKNLQNDKLKYVETDNIIPLLLQADLMLSDTSSVISEFLLQNKPAVTYKNRQPGPQLINIQSPIELKNAIKLGFSRPTGLMNNIFLYSEKIHPFTDGLSSNRVLQATDRLVESGLTHLESKPFNFIRDFKLRQKLGYYWI